MQDIRLVDNDGEYLNLETQGGEKFRLVLDDSLRSAIKRETQVQLDSVSISPREIQDEVRAGATAAEVASKHSVPFDYVEKFAQTVVDEIGHIIASAQTVRISVEADRYSDAAQVEFGEVLEGRLRKVEAGNITWSARKLEGNPWLVKVSYESPKGSAAAVWAFDQRKLVLTPENETAIKLSAGDFSASVSSPKLRQVDEVEVETRVIEIPRAPEVVVPPAESRPIVAPVSSIEELTRSSLQAIEDAAPAREEQMSPTADLLEALRKKRAEANSSFSEKNSTVDPQEVESDERVSEDDDLAEEPASLSAEEPIEEIAPAPVAPAAKKGRPSMPSWDEIVFGTKTDD